MTSRDCDKRALVNYLSLIMKDSPTCLENVENLQEWEMGKHQRGLVDNSFEEGQYSSALEMLEQLRSFTHRPSM